MKIENIVFHRNFAESSANWKSKTKGKFPVNIQTEGDRWKTEKVWQAKANPIARDAEIKWNQNDLKLLEKRRQQRILKNMAMESMWKK
eukprot:CAMPEP_0168328154 /NCGR_PEP_ID=MMETSP0213-20121227/6316_1 /TAXON_ID=151035 /ORGANISM="Euplotes harpa, Strain FSP1.4" /LENGTH=87 /DNA_ID=CAMNT_0008331179 /DNA_START=929 /DNA_END=1189 /DNA_ORIENTATION=+